MMTRTFDPDNDDVEVIEVDCCTRLMLADVRRKFDVKTDSEAIRKLIRDAKRATMIHIALSLFAFVCVGLVCFHFFIYLR